jgi:hypothetical protein
LRTRSAELLSNALDRGDVTRDELSRDLCLSPYDLELILDGSRVMSLKHQLCLSTLLIERVPRLARRAHTLRAQVTAAKAFGEQQTESHKHAPMSWRSAR